MARRILVIDDEIAIQHIVTRILTSNGYSVSNALDGKKGLEMLLTTFFDLILLDICMPLVSGNQVLQELQRKASTLPIVVMTATPEILKPTFQVKEVLVKPFGYRELTAVVQKALKVSNPLPVAA